ncbi:HNH endonuclease [Lutibacter sp.]|uniref:HNH endonuclease n=1 Tax=Lutibacter sp. TaxID=1925666 RepID=UPI002735A2E2|nr:HNH endonuclease [Lutibacter sp.]MDP3314147.1 HNH endonuclease [Lutibacter sp.]
MINEFRNEVWKPYSKENWHEDDEYMASNYGRIKKKKVYEEEWKLSKSSLVTGYDSFGVKLKGKYKSSSCYVHRVIALLFVEKREDQQFVLHLDYNKVNNVATNLKWANRQELNLHYKNNPVHKTRLGRRTYSKLTENRVRLIKRKINDPNRRTRMRIIARQFGISEMQLYRIKSGENWGSVKELDAIKKNDK